MKCNCGQENCKGTVVTYIMENSLGLMVTSPTGAPTFGNRLTPQNALLLAAEIVQKANALLGKVT